MSTWLNSVRSIFLDNKKTVDALQTFREFGIKSRKWWGTYQVEAGQSRFWRVGNVIVCVDRFTNEWHIASTTVGKVGDIDGNSQNLEEDDDSNLKVPYEQLQFKTYTFRTQAEITLEPVLPDRPLASKLERQFIIPGGEDILLYVSSPVWVRIQTGKSKIVLTEIPTFVLSDTWFGPNTREGVLCYSGHTYCSPHLKDVPSGPDRIISPMLIKNHARTPLVLEKISVPLPYLSVYKDAENFLWTEQLYVYREDDENPEVEVAKGPPKALEKIQKLTQARKDLYTASSLKRLFVGNLAWE